MADVRAMLRSELASRKPEQQASKKRKAAPEPTEPETKKARNEASQPSTALDNVVESPSKSLPTRESPVSEVEPTNLVSQEDETVSTAIDVSVQSQAQTGDGIDEDEWAAFERDVATPPPEEARAQAGLSALNAPATITAQPLSAEEIAAQAREQESTQGRGKKDVELEEEREEAQLALQDEFEEMEGLEERVRKLREKREAIRRASDSRPNVEGDGLGSKEDARRSALEAVAEEKQKSFSDGEESESDDDDDDWNLWRR